jgi:hypothetical protein
VAIIKDRHARIIIVRPEITLHLEAGYIFAGCSRRNRFFLQFGGGPYMFSTVRCHLPLSAGALERLKPNRQVFRCLDQFSSLGDQNDSILVQFLYVASQQPRLFFDLALQQ